MNKKWHYNLRRLVTSISLISFVCSCSSISHYSNTSRSIASDNDTAEIERITSYVNAYDILGYPITRSEDTVFNRLTDETQRFISSYKNKDLLEKTPEGTRLLAYQSKALSFTNAKRALSKSFDNDRSLSLRILEAMAKTPAVQIYSSEKQASLLTSQSTTTYLTELQNQYSAEALQKWQGLVIREAMIGSLINYLSIEYSLSDIDLNELEPNSAVNAICNYDHPKLKMKLDYCTPEMRKEFSTAAQDLISQWKQLPESRPEKFGLSGTLTDLNARIVNINDALRKITVGSDSAKIAYDIYLKAYIEATAQGPGILLVTDTVKEKSGELRQITKYLSSIKATLTNNYRLKLHKFVDQATVIRALNEAKNMIAGHMYNLKGRYPEMAIYSAFRDIGKYSQAKFVNLSLARSADLMIYNVNAVGRVLLKHPEYAALTARVVSEVTKLDLRQEKIDKAYAFGSMVVGIALTITGYGAGAGGWLISGAAAAEIFGSVEFASWMTLYVLDAGDIGYSSYRAYQAKVSLGKLEEAIVAGTGDVRTANEAVKRQIEFREAMKTAAVSLGFTVGYGVIYGKAAFSVPKAEVDPKLAETMNKTIHQFADDPILHESAMAAAKTTGTGKLAEFLGHLSTFSENLRMKIITRIASSSSTETVIKIMEEVLADASI